METVKNKKRAIIILVVFVLVASAVVFFALKYVMDDLVSKVELDNGDEIILNQGGIREETLATQPFDESYVILSEKEFAQDYPEQAERTDKVNLPKETKDLEHCYQMRADNQEKLPEGFDEIYQWETEVYDDAQAKVYPTQRNSGYRYEVADRGYMELSIYKERPQRIKLENTFKSTKNVNSSVNGKKVCIWENPIEKINSERKFYTAEFQDIDGKGTGAYFTADNVDRDYFIAVLEILAGRDYPMPETAGGKQAGKADSEKAFVLAREEIEFRNAAEKIIYDREKTEIAKHEQEGFSIVARYHRKPKEQDGKKYNISCEYFIKGTGSETWYMLLEKRDSRIVEIGETLIVPI